MPEDRSAWYERVRVATVDPTKGGIDGKLGAIVGKVQDDDGRWLYGVFVYDERTVWSCLGNELLLTGEFDRRESFYSGESIRVSEHVELLE